MSEKRSSTRKEQKARTREALIEAAMACFAEQGLDAPSLDSICERAGYTRGAFYVHFRTRDDLIVAVMERFQRATLEGLVRTGGDELPLSATMKMFAAAVDSGLYPPATGAVKLHQLLDASHRSPAIRKRNRDSYLATRDRLAELVASRQKAGEVRDDVAPENVALLLTLVVAGVELLAEYGEMPKIDSGTEMLLELLDAKTD